MSSNNFKRPRPSSSLDNSQYFASSPVSESGGRPRPNLELEPRPPPAKRSRSDSLNQSQSTLGGYFSMVKTYVKTFTDKLIGRQRDEALPVTPTTDEDDVQVLNGRSNGHSNDDEEEVQVVDFRRRDSAESVQFLSESRNRAGENYFVDGETAGGQTSPRGVRPKNTTVPSSSYAHEPGTLVKRIKDKNIGPRSDFDSQFRVAPDNVNSFRYRSGGMYKRGLFGSKVQPGLKISSPREMMRRRSGQYCIKPNDKKIYLLTLEAIQQNDIKPANIGYFKDVLLKKQHKSATSKGNSSASSSVLSCSAASTSGLRTPVTMEKNSEENTKLEIETLLKKIKENENRRRAEYKTLNPEIVNLTSSDEDDEKEKQKESANEVEVIKSRQIERPEASSKADADVQEMLDKYSTKLNSTATDSGKKKHVEKKAYNGLEAELRLSKSYQTNYIEDITRKYDANTRELERKEREAKVKLTHSRERREALEKSVEDRLARHLKITEVPIDEVESEDEDQLPEFTSEMQSVVQRALGSRGETLVDKFNIPIALKDIKTLTGLQWLNDEVINFYMSMIVERSESHDNWPKCYAFNTFFYSRLVEKGFASVKRWTRKVDIFKYDLLIVPVHLGVHWCLATIDFRKPGIYYYDSMSGNNHTCLSTLKKYLSEEHQDKKKSPYDTSKFECVLRKDIPQQENMSDCGMFSCKHAEYLSRDAKITFTQTDMPYFRRRMIYEIVSAKIMHP